MAINFKNLGLARSDEDTQPCTSTSVSSDADESSDCDPPTAKRPALASSESVEIANFVGSRSLSADSRYTGPKVKFLALSQLQDMYMGCHRHFLSYNRYPTCEMSYMFPLVEDM